VSVGKSAFATIGVDKSSQLYNIDLVTMSWQITGFIVASQLFGGQSSDLTKKLIK
jgi:hypothetical protein